MIALPAAKSLPALRAINKTEFFTIASEERRLKDTPSATKFGGEFIRFDDWLTCYKIGSACLY